MAKRKPKEKNLSEKLSELELRKLRKEIRLDYQEGYSFEEIKGRISDEYRVSQERLEEILASELPQSQPSRAEQKEESDILEDIKKTSLAERIGGLVVFGALGYFTGYTLFPWFIERLTGLGKMSDEACAISGLIFTGIGALKGLATGFKTYYN
jgi:hypothetical protein